MSSLHTVYILYIFCVVRHGCLQLDFFAETYSYISYVYMHKISLSDWKFAAFWYAQICLISQNELSKKKLHIACVINKRRCGYTLHFHTFPCNLNSAFLKNGPAPGSESPAFVSIVLHDQDIDSAIYNAPALQPPSLLWLPCHNGIGNTCTVRVILPQTGSLNWNKCVHGHSSK